MRVKHEIRVLASDVMATDSDSSEVSSDKLSKLDRLICVFDELAQQRLNFLSSELWQDFQSSAVLKAWHAKIRARIKHQW